MLEQGQSITGHTVEENTHLPPGVNCQPFFRRAGPHGSFPFPSIQDEMCTGSVFPRSCAQKLVCSESEHNSYSILSRCYISPPSGSFFLHPLLSISLELWGSDTEAQFRPKNSMSRFGRRKKNQKLQENKKQNLPSKPFPLPYILPKVSESDGNLVIGQPTLLRTRNKVCAQASHNIDQSFQRHSSTQQLLASVMPQTSVRAT